MRKRKIVNEGDHLRYFDGTGKSFICDKEDLQVLQDHYWLIDTYGYPVTKVDRRTTRFTRMILHPSKEECIDHINGDTLDNRRSNLRIASRLNNQRNMGMPKHNTSGYKGVGYRKDRGKYRAYISLNDETHHIGYFNTAEEAARAYDRAARFYFGQYACLNFPEEGEQSCFRNQKPEEVAMAI